MAGTDRSAVLGRVKGHDRFAAPSAPLTRPARGAGCRLRVACGRVLVGRGACSSSVCCAGEERMRGVVRGPSRKHPASTSDGQHPSHDRLLRRSGEPGVLPGCHGACMLLRLAPSPARKEVRSHRRSNDAGEHGGGRSLRQAKRRASLRGRHGPEEQGAAQVGCHGACRSWPGGSGRAKRRASLHSGPDTGRRA